MTFVIDLAELEKARRWILKGNSLGIALEAKKYILEGLREEGFDINEMMAEQLSKL